VLFFSIASTGVAHEGCRFVFGTVWGLVSGAWEPGPRMAPKRRTPSLGFFVFSTRKQPAASFPRLYDAGPHRPKGQGHFGWGPWEVPWGLGWAVEVDIFIWSSGRKNNAIVAWPSQGGGPVARLFVSLAGGGGGGGTGGWVPALRPHAHGTFIRFLAPVILKKKNAKAKTSPFSTGPREGGDGFF